MPWTSRGARRHTRKANTPHKQKVWARVANRVLRKTHSEARAVRSANAVVARMRRKSGRRRR